MPVNLSIKNVPDDVVKRLEARAARHHRSLQGEFMAIVQTAAREEEADLLEPREVVARLRAAGFRTPSDSVEIIRRMRKSRGGARRR